MLNIIVALSTILIYSNIYAQDDGTLKWSFETSNEIQSSPAIDKYGVIYFGSFDGTFYAVNPDGSMKWQYSVGQPIYSSPAIGINDNIYFGANDLNLYALNLEGEKIWNYEVGLWVESSPSIGYDGTIFVGFGFSLYSIEPDGTVNWHFRTNGDIRTSSAIDIDYLYLFTC